MRRWWKIAIPTGFLLASIAAVLVWMSFEPEYEASALIQIDAKQVVIAFEANGHSYGRDDGYVATQINLLSGNIVLLGSNAYLEEPGAKCVVDRVLDGEIAGWQHVEELDAELIAARKLDASSRRVDLAAWLSDRITVSQAGKRSTIYSVSFRSPDPTFSQEIVNSVVQTYFDVLKAQRGAQEGELLGLLKTQRDIRKPGVEEKRRELNELITKSMKDGALINLTSEAVDPRISLRQQFAEAEMERTVLEHRVGLLREAVGQPVEINDSQLQQALLNDPNVQRMQGQIRELAMLATDIDNSSASTGHSESARMRGKVDSMTEQLQLYQNQIVPQLRESLIGQERRARQETLAEAETSLKNSEALLEALGKQHEDLLADLSAGNADSLDAERNIFELELERDVLARIENRIIQLETESKAPPREQLWRWADKPVHATVELPTREWIMFVFPALLRRLVWPWPGRCWYDAFRVLRIWKKHSILRWWARSHDFLANELSALVSHDGKWMTL